MPRLAAIGVLFAVVSAYGQTCRPGELRVRVVDSQESDVFDATVKATSKGVTLGPRSTGAGGEVEFEAACGTWEITVTKEGFETALRNTEMTSGATVDLREIGRAHV